MIPRLPPGETIDPLHQRFLGDLVAGGFRGDVRADAAARLVAATDNSVYHFAPQAVVFPRSAADVVALCRLAGQPDYHRIRMTPRGAGTGTTGGALGSGLAVDLSRHMNRILDFDEARGTVRVEPGVVLDQLNAHLRPHGVFFAPHVATSDRATLGGMIGNDSCGVGSRLYGRTSQHVEALRVVLSDGSSWLTRPLPAAGECQADLPPRITRVLQVVQHAARQHGPLLRNRLPAHSRFLSGYDIVHAVGADGRIDVARLITGSEGTLAFVVEATLRVTPIPPHRTLVVAAYASFDAALVAADRLLSFAPAAIESIDDRILTLVRSDELWPKVAARLTAPALAGAAALHLIELCDESGDRLAERARALCSAAAREATGVQHVDDDDEARALWAMRARGVGLLGNMPGGRRPLPFVEDCAVPPARLPEFVRAFRAILDEYGLAYGMYGHADVGCIHVRPALDMTDADDARTLRQVSDRVFRLVGEYGGVFWGEHGKGVRSEYSPALLGPEIYTAMRQIKEAFDPYNQMNPGKVATPTSSEAALLRIGDSTRGERDRGIAPAARSAFADAVACNGNGACFSWDVDRTMCPSMKVTRDRVHSPQGRAALMREWLRLLSTHGWDVGHAHAAPAGSFFAPKPWIRRMLAGGDFSHEVHAAFAGCLACKACVTQCPVHVDIPRFKAEFLHAYHQRYPRRLRDHLIGSTETALPRMATTLRAVDRFAPVAARLIGGAVGLSDLPRIAAASAEDMLRRAGAEFLAWEAEFACDADAGTTAIVLDAFTNFFAPDIAIALHDLIRRGDTPVVVLPYRASGKSHHVRGFLHEFAAIAARNAGDLERLATAGYRLLCIEPAVALCFRQEYRSVIGAGDLRVALPQEWLATRAQEIGRAAGGGRAYRLLSHCAEATTAPAANHLWKDVFASAGLELEIPAVGCCGMAGGYGHEAEQAANSRAIFDLSWRRYIDGVDPSRILATGHSCRTQVERVTGVIPRHPLQVIAGIKRGAG